MATTKFKSEISSTSWSTTYSSAWLDPEKGLVDEVEIPLLAHVNCTYLSCGRPPTLEALKQHAQSLTNLIRKLAISTEQGVINGEAEGQHPQFAKFSAFDWLNNLDKPYTNDDEGHHLPLWGLLNNVKQEKEMGQLEYVCPLTPVRDLGELGKSEQNPRPYRQHHNLVVHVNECLEILDHEYAATGGLLSLLPTDSAEDSEQMAAARNTIFGQWLLHHQHLVGRMHELEINYANALDLLAGEAVVPMQMNSRHGVDRLSKGRQLAYPQDRFVLANAGDDVFDCIHRYLDKEEAQVERTQKIWLENGVSGRRLWEKDRGGDWYSRGMVPVDLKTRFYRVMGHGNKSTIFVLPAIEQHPAVTHTRKLENRPTVVSVVTPIWPERVSELEGKYDERLKDADETQQINRFLERKQIMLQDRAAAAQAQMRKMKSQLDIFYEVLGADDNDIRAKCVRLIASVHQKFDQLMKVLPEEYHGHLDLGGDDEEQE